MAALDTPWLAHMATPSRASARADGDVDGSAATPAVDSPYGSVPPTYAAFSSSSLSTAATSAARRSTILVHQKSPLLLATPPQITRALAYSHPFLLPLNKLAGLLSWTTGDPWESFLLLAAFWAVVHYGDVVVRFAGPIVAVTIIIAGMYGRRYSPLSSSGWAEHPAWQPSNKASKNTNTVETSPNGGAAKKGEHTRNTSEITNTRHQKTLDEIVDTVKVFTTRCNILLEPMLRMTDFLSTQRTATSATTRPALTTLFVRILAVTPIWIALTLPPLRIVTTKRVVMFFGTVVLSWHSRVCRVTRTLLWRSALVRKVARWITGLQFEGPKKPTHGAKEADGKSDAKADAKANGKALATPEKNKRTSSASALTAAIQRRRRSAYGKETGVRFTFIIYENQRRWVGLGWTNSLFAYERAAWTDEHNNPVPPRDEFELPEVEEGPGKWRWVKGSKWRVDGAPDVQDDSEYDGEAAKNGWIFYDNKWNNGRRGQDGWGRWTRRRKWYRDAELVEVDDEAQEQALASPEAVSPSPPALPPRQNASQSAVELDASTLSTSAGTTTSELAQSQSSKDNDKEDTDSLSVLSNSSKSARFKWPTLGGHSNHSAPQLRKKASRDTKRSRRPSDGGSVHENDISLTPALELEIQGSRKDQDTWGFGDDVTMGLA